MRISNVNAKVTNLGCFTPLHTAASRGDRSQITKMLLEASANIESEDDSGRTPLMWAAGSGSLEDVEILLRAKANVNGKANQGLTALICAASSGHLDVVNTLLAAGADPNSRTNDGRTALIEASTGEGHWKVVWALLAKGADSNARVNGNVDRTVFLNEKGGTALMVAARYNHADIVTALLVSGADVDGRSDDGYTALIEAASEGKPEILRILLGAGADVQATTDKGETALMRARGKIRRGSLLGKNEYAEIEALLTAAGTRS